MELHDSMATDTTKDKESVAEQNVGLNDVLKTDHIEIDDVHNDDTATDDTLTSAPPKNVSFAINYDNKANSTPNVGNVIKITSQHDSYLAQVKANQKEIANRFIEMLSLFNNYTKIIASRESDSFKLPELRRTQSDEALYLRVSKLDHEYPQASTSVCNLFSDNTQPVQSSAYPKIGLSNATAASSALLKKTCSANIQTSSSCLAKTTEKPDNITGDEYKFDNKKNSQPNNTHTIMIEVESTTSAAALHRQPIRTCLWNMLAGVGHALTVGIMMIGENFTYALFVVFCLWCLYFIFTQYSSFISSSMIQNELKKEIVPPANYM